MRTPQRFSTTNHSIGARQKLRINTGKLKGLSLGFLKHSQALCTTRPTKAILRESFFNSLGVNVIDSTFIEAFAGSGSMGIEALSRGAKCAVFFESNRNAACILKENIHRAKQRVQDLEFVLYEKDFFEAFAWVDSLQDRSILYLDPPFFVRKGMDGIYERVFTFVSRLQNPFITLLAFEGMSACSLPQTLGNYDRMEQKRFGKSTISYFVNTRGVLHG
ncbi:MAG: 16S rRNA (guanine(966)-N(2))-methyltransferase RsmD [Helicobacter sp.]|nr:16S rRNA (guanine(966)-N(2))-methyltransferase RsmD [Helicobacter sp.]